MSPSKPQTFYLHVNRDALMQGSDNVWIIQINGRAIIAKDVQVDVPLKGVYRGPDAPQPKVYLKGKAYGYWLEKASGGHYFWLTENSMPALESFKETP